MRRALFAAEILVLALVVRHWAYITTYRLYLDRRIEPPPQSAAAQQFDIESDRVVPRIATRGADRLAFASRVNQDATIRVGLRPASHVAYRILWRDGLSRRTLASGVADAPISLACAFPTGNGIIELVSDGPATWIDPRIVRSLQVRRHLTLLAVLLLASIMAGRARGRRGEPGTTRLAWFKAVAAAASVGLALLAAEAALRAAGDHLPAGIAAERHDLGEVTRDPRWESSQRYDRRLRARVDAVNEWRHGDIVRMGYIPASVSPGALHRFRFLTDAEGFRNAHERPHFDIAALGDSFTDAMTMDAGHSWPAQLERRLGVAVQNYGTAGFGPQQELLVLKDYVAAHRPSLVVLAFFAGNDLFDAEAFDDFQRSSGRAARAVPGWRIKDVVSRADTWFVVSAVRAATTWAAQAQPSTRAEAATPESTAADTVEVVSGFDRGMFTVPVRGRRLQWAFMPPYLNTLNFSEDELRHRRGWTLTRSAILEMQRTTALFGAEFVVMFLPFKAQVYWPLMERSLAADAVRSAMRFYLDGNQRAVDVDAMRRNRLAQNRLLGQLCEHARIPFLDTSEALEARLDSGENVYFPDESHFNETGQAVVADQLAAFLRTRYRLPSGRSSRLPHSSQAP